MDGLPFTQLIDGLEPLSNGRLQGGVPDDWMQGRTTYGGLTAALCHEGARRLAEDRPLRAVQVAFIGPSGGELVVAPSVLRKGKNATTISVDLVGEGGIAARCLFTFGAARASHLDMAELTAPDTPPPEAVEPYMARGVGPAFTRHFNLQLAAGPAPFAGADSADVRVWLRHRDPEVHNRPVDPTHLLAIGDVPPPAAMGMMKEPGMISSMTWMVEFLTETPTTDDGWWLNRSQAQTARNGYSSQAMTLWNRKGEPIMVGRQTIAIFS